METASACTCYCKIGLTTINISSLCCCSQWTFGQRVSDWANKWFLKTRCLWTWSAYVQNLFGAVAGDHNLPFSFNTLHQSHISDSQPLDNALTDLRRLFKTENKWQILSFDKSTMFLCLYVLRHVREISTFYCTIFAVRHSLTWCQHIFIGYIKCFVQVISQIQQCVILCWFWIFHLQQGSKILQCWWFSAHLRSFSVKGNNYFP